MIVVEQPLHKIPQHCRDCPNQRRSLIMRDGQYCRVTGRTTPDEGRAEWCPLQKVKVTESCAGCQFQGSADRCKTCSRRYLDRFSPPPPPKKSTHAERMALGQLLAFSATAAFMEQKGSRM